jgi:Type IV secretion system pilin
MKAPMKLHKIHYSIIAFLSFIPTLVLAQSFSLTAGGVTFKTVIFYILGIINLLNPLLFALAFILFFWGLSKFILNSGKPEDRKNGRSYMIWGILALFVLLTFQAIISGITGSRGLDIGGNSGVRGVLLPTSAPAP